jgi:hypothetical protein
VGQIFWTLLCRKRPVLIGKRIFLSDWEKIKMGNQILEFAFHARLVLAGTDPCLSIKNEKNQV